MELYVLGIKPPPLFSPQDIVLRQFMANRRGEQVRGLKSILSTLLGNSEEGIKSFKEYVRSVTFLEGAWDEANEDLAKEYELIKKTDLQIRMDDGVPVVEKSPTP